MTENTVEGTAKAGMGKLEAGVGDVTGNKDM